MSRFDEAPLHTRSCCQRCVAEEVTSLIPRILICFSARVQSIGNALLLWRVVRISANSFLRIIMNYSVLLNVTEMVIAIIHIANRIIRKLLFLGRVGSCMILHEITSYHFWADGN